MSQEFFTIAEAHAVHTKNRFGDSASSVFIYEFPCREQLVSEPIETEMSLLEIMTARKNK